MCRYITGKEKINKLSQAVHVKQTRELYMWTCIMLAHILSMTYRKTSSISRTKFQNVNVYCILMQLSSLNSLKPGVKLIMKM